MVQLYLPLLVVGTISAQRQFVPFFRDARNLRDVFPFSAVEDQHHDHGDDGNYGDYDDGGSFRDYGDEDIRREDRQGDSAQSVPFDDVASSYAQGKR